MTDHDIRISRTSTGSEGRQVEQAQPHPRADIGCIIERLSFRRMADGGAVNVAVSKLKEDASLCWDRVPNGDGEGTDTDRLGGRRRTATDEITSLLSS